MNAEEARNAVVKAEGLIKFAQIMSNPGRAIAILSSKGFDDNLEDFFGTDDPIEIASQVSADLLDYIKNGQWTVSRLAFYGGCYACVQAFESLFPPAFIFSPLYAVTQFYQFFFGIVIMAIESDGNTVSEGFKNSIFHNCRALENQWGRNLLYFYFGATNIVAPIGWVLGVWFLGVACVQAVVDALVRNKLSQLEEVFGDEKVMKREFDKYSGTDGNLNRSELQMLLRDLGVILTHAELEGMFKRLDPDHKGMISWPHFKLSITHQTHRKMKTYKVGPIEQLLPGEDHFHIERSTKPSRTFGYGFVGSQGSSKTHRIDWDKISHHH